MANTAAEIYRQTVIGDHLADVLETFVENGKLNEAMAQTVMKQFDLVSMISCALAMRGSGTILTQACMQSFLEAMQHVSAKATIQADLKTYKYFDNVSVALVLALHNAQNRWAL